MDLSTQPPRSALDRLAGVVMAARTTDKARAHLAGTLGAYIYNCPLDKELFEFLGTDADEFLDVVRRAPGDEEVVTFIRYKLAGRAEEEILAWNQDFLRYEPDLTRPGYREAREALARRAPDRPDLTLWVDVVDVEEGRPVPTVEQVRERKALLGLGGS